MDAFEGFAVTLGLYLIMSVFLGWGLAAMLLGLMFFAALS